ncbi:hypothetical protein PAERUG_P5_London_26_VIM_2_01_09_03357 [Pseudomonas aeruginosa]|nr:hypothetical protein PAERUG_P5_London_26_VIM_2_01_09_03357 [Pseudomonas aeruginosa]
MLDVGGVGLPLVGVRLRHLDRLPFLVAGEDLGVLLVEHLGVDLLDRLGDFLLARPDVLQVDRLAVLAGAQRFLAEVDPHAAGQGVGHHQRRRGQPVGLHQRVHAAFEVAVAGEYRGDGQVGLLDGFLDRLQQRAGVADAGGAAVADQVEAEFVEVAGQAGGLEVVGDHLGARRQRTLHPGLALQAFFHRLLRQQAGGHHHAGVGGVGAGGDGGDHHRAVLQAVGLAVVLVVDLAEGGVGADRGAAAALAEQAAFFGAGGMQLQAEELVEGAGDVLQGHAVLRALRSGQAGLDFAHVQVQGVGEHRLVALLAPQALFLAVGLDQLDRAFRTSGQAQVAEGDLVHREEAAGGAVFRGHVGDGGAVRQGQVGQAVAVELDEFPHHALLAQHLRDGQHQVGGGDALAQLAGELEADDLGDQHRYRLAEHGGFRLDAADAPAEHAEAVDHGGVGVGADQGVGEGVGPAILVLGPDRAAQVLQVDLVADAGARRYHAEVVEGVLAPAQEGVAFAVALHLDLNVLFEGRFAGELVDHHRVVDDQVHRRQRVDLLRVAAGLGHGRAHGGQVDHRGNPGEVLHQDPRRAVLDLAVGAALPEPAGEGLEVVAGDGAAVLPAQEVFQQDLQRHRQLAEIAQGPGGFREAVVVVGLAVHSETAKGFQAVQSRHF